MSLKPATNRQIPDNAILDMSGKQAYLGNQFVVSTGFVSGQESETPLLYLNNPIANNFPQNITIFNCVRKCLVDTSGIVGVFNFYLNPTTVTGGSTAALNSLRPANGYISVMSGLISPSVASKGTYLFSLNATPCMIDIHSLLILDPGYSVLITAYVSGTSNVCAELIWYEM